MAFVQPSTAEDTNEISGNLAKHVTKIAARIMNDFQPRPGCLGALLDSLRQLPGSSQGTLRSGSAGAAGYAAASLTAAARGALPAGRSGRRDGHFRSNKGILLLT